MSADAADQGIPLPEPNRVLKSFGLLSAAWKAAVGARVVMRRPFLKRRARLIDPDAVFPVCESHDIRYHAGRDRQTLDVFAPEGVQGCPVVIVVHGGAWMYGDKNLFGLYRSVGRFLARHGVVAVNINYRLSPLVRHPEHLRDLARALRWARLHAAEYGGDPDRIILCGHSAGGHLVSLLATAQDSFAETELELTPADRAAVRGVIAVSGVYRIPDAEEFEQMAKATLAGFQFCGVPVIPEGWKNLLLERRDQISPFRLVFGDDQNVRDQASPLNHVRPGLPPFLLLYAGRDLPRLPAMAHDFADALARHGNEVDIHKIESASHNRILFNLDRRDDAVGPYLLDFIDRRVSPASETEP